MLFVLLLELLSALTQWTVYIVQKLIELIVSGLVLLASMSMPGKDSDTDGKTLIDEEKSKDFWLTLLVSRERLLMKHRSILKSWDSRRLTPIQRLNLVEPCPKCSDLPKGHICPQCGNICVGSKCQTTIHCKQYEELGYPVKKLQVYAGTTIVGFPTRPEICRLGMGDKLVTAAEATPEEQFQIFTTS
jgi:hypothetical protein